MQLTDINEIAAIANRHRTVAPVTYTWSDNSFGDKIGLYYSSSPREMIFTANLDGTITFTQETDAEAIRWFASDINLLLTETEKLHRLLTWLQSFWIIRMLIQYYGPRITRVDLNPYRYFSTVQDTP